MRPLDERTATPRHGSISDVLDRVESLEEFERTGRRDSPLGTLNRGAARFVLRARDQLLRSLRSRGRADPRSRRVGRTRPCCGRCWRRFPIGWPGGARRAAGAA